MSSPHLLLLTIFIFSLFLGIEPQSGTVVDQQDPSQEQDSVPTTYRPSIAVIIGILAVMMSLTFLLLVYAKYCNLSASDFFNIGDDQQQGPEGNQGRGSSSGIDKAIIDSLPFFQFSTLKGSKQGLECAVCLSKFDDTEVLRLLPKCKHAFHLDCIDKWLESHSTCPMCRRRVELEDLAKFTYSNSLRLARDPSSLREEPQVELFVCRELDEQASAAAAPSFRFSIGSSFRRLANREKLKKDEPLISEGNQEEPFLHKFKHKIIVSDVVFNNRWSDLNSSDLLSLNSEMLNAASSERFTVMDTVTEDGLGSSSNQPVIMEGMERKASPIERNKNAPSLSATDIPSTSLSNEKNMNASNIPKLFNISGKRSMSEITNFSRFVDFSSKNRIKDSSNNGENSTVKEEKRRKLWLPIAKRTVQWFSGRERRAEFQDSKEQLPNV